MRVGVCENFTECALAQRHEPQEIAPGERFSCRECGLELVESAKPPNGGRSWKPIAAALAGALAIAAIGVFLYYLSYGPSSVADKGPNPGPSTPMPKTPPPPQREAKVVLRLAGSNTIGGELAPALVKEYLVSRGAAHVEAKSTAKDEVIVSAELDGGQVGVSIAAHGTVTGFKALAEGSADIGNASRQMHSDEESSLRQRDIARAFGSEYVIGLDGIAVIINKSNPIDRLTIEQLGKIFAGQILSWEEVGGQMSWPIHLYARNQDSGTWETFDQIVLHAGREPLKLSPAAERIEDSTELSGKVSRDPYGIGFIGLPYIKESKGLLISAVNHPFYPTLYTVRTETYPLSRRLYMYAPRASANPEIARFLQFVGSTAGQKVVERIGFVSLDVTPPAAEELSPIFDLPSMYRQLFARLGAHEPFETTIHFRTDSSIVDSRGKDDLARILAYIANRKLSPQDLVLIGHADGTGPHPVNCTLSQNRAKAVGEELASFGLRAKDRHWVLRVGARCAKRNRRWSGKESSRRDLAVQDRAEKFLKVRLRFRPA